MNITTGLVLVLAFSLVMSPVTTYGISFSGNYVTTTSAATTSSVRSNNSACSDCVPPTLGTNNIRIQIVKDGFSYNGNSVDVGHFYTPFPLITVKVGEPNIAEFKIFENSGVDNIRHFEFAFGLDKGQIISKSKSLIEYSIDSQGYGILNIVDPDNVIDNESVIVERQTVYCTDDSERKCLLIRIYHTFRAPLDFDMVATNVWDHKRNAWQNYYNHGISVEGESLNEQDGISANNGTLRLHALTGDYNHVKIMIDENHKVFILSNDGWYYPKTNNSSLYHKFR